MHSCNLMFYFFTLQILAGLLQLGNVNFSSSTDDSQPCNLDKESGGIIFAPPQSNRSIYSVYIVSPPFNMNTKLILFVS